MRIPSQFNEDSLYRRKPDRGRDNDTFRRLIRLSLGLLLVLVVMRQAARPKIYQVFFGAPPEQGAVGSPAMPSDQQPDGEIPPGKATDRDGAAAGLSPYPPQSPTTPSTPIPERPASESAAAIEINAADRRIADRLTAGLLPSDRRQWTLALARWQSARPVEQIPSTIQSVRELLTSISPSSADDAETNPGRIAAWLAMLETLEQSASAESISRPNAAERSLAAAWIESLDQTAANEVVDGSTWRSGDFGLFYRYLDQAPELSAANTAATGVLPLLQQPDVYRNRRVRLAGQVARCERFDAQPNVFGIEQYYQLWLRPSDGADRPIVAIVLDVPDAVSAVGADAVATDGPPITMVGRYLKRLAYRSQKGADLAPVVVGRLLTAPVAADERNSVSRQISPPETGTLWLVLTLACLIGLSVAVVAMWRTGVSARRSRQLRTAHRPPPDLDLPDPGSGALGSGVLEGRVSRYESDINAPIPPESRRGEP